MCHQTGFLSSVRFRGSRLAHFRQNRAVGRIGNQAERRGERNPAGFKKSFGGLGLEPVREPLEEIMVHGFDNTNRLAFLSPTGASWTAIPRALELPADGSQLPEKSDFHNAQLFAHFSRRRGITGFPSGVLHVPFRQYPHLASRVARFEKRDAQLTTDAPNNHAAGGRLMDDREPARRRSKGLRAWRDARATAAVHSSDAGVGVGCGVGFGVGFGLGEGAGGFSGTLVGAGFDGWSHCRSAFAARTFGKSFGDL